MNWDLKSIFAKIYDITIFVPKFNSLNTVQWRIEMEKYEQKMANSQAVIAKYNLMHSINHLTAVHNHTRE